MSLLVRPYGAVLLVLMPRGILLTRLVVCHRIHVTQVVTSIDRFTIHMDMYADVLAAKIVQYMPKIHIAGHGSLCTIGRNVTK